MPVDHEDSCTLDDDSRPLQNSSSALGSAEGLGVSSMTASTQQADLGQPFSGSKSEEVDDRRKASARSNEDSDSDSDADLNVCDLEESSRPTGGGSGAGAGCGGEDDDNDIDRRNEKLQALMAEADRIAGSWKRNRLGGGGSDASDAEDEGVDGEGGDIVDVERKDFGKECTASALFGNDNGSGGKPFQREADDNCSESAAKSDSDNSVGRGGGGRKTNRARRIIYVARMPREDMPYEHWSQKNLRMACRNRGIRSMSRCKDNRIMAKHLAELDKWEKRESPYLGDFRLERGGQSGVTGRSFEMNSSSSEGSSRFSAIPEDVKLNVQNALDLGATFPYDRPILYGGCSYRTDDVLAAISAQRDRAQRYGGFNPPDRACESGGTAEESGGTRGEKGTIVRAPATQPHDNVCVGEGKTRALKASQHSDGGNRFRMDWGFKRANPAHTAEDRDEGGWLGQEYPGSTTKGEDCAPRLVTMIVDKNRDSSVALSEAEPSRGALDAGPVGARSKRWQDFHENLVDPEVGDRLSGRVRFIDIDPSEVEHVDMSAETQRAILKKIVSKSNSNVKASSRCTDTEELRDQCQENDQDTRYLVLAVERPPKLLEKLQREGENGAEGAGDAQRRREAAIKGRDREESHVSARKKARLEKETRGHTKVVVHDTCSIVGPEISKSLGSSPRGSIEGVELCHTGAGSKAKFDEEICRAEAECSRLKLNRARREERNDIFKRRASYDLALQRTDCESIEATVRTRRLFWAGALIRMDDRRLPKRIMSGALEKPRRRGLGGKEKEWTDCVADDLRTFGIGNGEGWKTTALEPERWCDIVMEGGRTFMAAWRKEEERAAESRRKKRESEEADKVPIAPGVIAGQLRRFRAALIGPLRRPPKRRRLLR